MRSKMFLRCSESGLREKKERKSRNCELQTIWGWGVDFRLFSGYVPGTGTATATATGYMEIIIIIIITIIIIGTVTVNR